MPNYTISTSTTQEATGDSVLDAAGFSAGTFPSGVSSVTFSNSTTANAVDNVVNVTVNYANTLAMASADILLNINLCGDATAVVTTSSVPILIRFLLAVEETTHLGGVSTRVLTNSPFHSSTNRQPFQTQTATGSYNTNQITNFGITGSYGVHSSFYTHDVYLTFDSTGGTQTVAQGTVTVCDPSEDPKVNLEHKLTWDNGNLLPGSGSACGVYDPTGYVCDITPRPMISGVTNMPVHNLPSNRWNGYIEKLYYNSAGFVNKFDWKIDFSGYTQAELDAENIITPSITMPGSIVVVGNVTFRVGNQNQWINSYTIDKLEDSASTLTVDGWDIPVSDLGESRDLTVAGTPGATFSVTFVDDASNTTILASPITNVVMPSGGRYDWTQVFPSLASGTATYTLVVLAGVNTTLSGLFLARTPSATFIYSQISTIPNISLGGSSSSSFSTSTTQSVSTTFAPNYRFGSTNNTFPVSMSITKVGGGNLSITRQPVWPGDWSNSDSETNEGTDINLSGLTVTGSGTSTLTLSGTGSRSRIGTSSTTMNLALDNFINTTTSTTPITGISLNTSPVATQSFNLTDGIDVKAVLTPSNPTTPALTWTVSGSGFTITPATDTQSALVNSASTPGTRIVTATATDGSNVTATINVTATQQVLETVADTISVYSGRSTVIDITANDTTLGGGCTVVIESDPEVGSLSVSGQTVTYTALDFAAEDTFTYKLTKSGLAASNISTVTVLVGVN